MTAVAGSRRSLQRTAEKIKNACHSFHVVKLNLIYTSVLCFSRGTPSAVLSFSFCAIRSLLP